MYEFSFSSFRLIESLAQRWDRTEVIDRAFPQFPLLFFVRFPCGKCE